MLVLGLDTATPTASIGLIDGHSVIGEYSLRVERVHSKRLMPMVDGLLKEANLRIQDVRGIAVSAGPGSFTGLRIGMAAAKGLAYALSVPLVGVSTLEALSFNCVPTMHLLCPILDARMSELYSALYRWQDSRLVSVVSDSVMTKGTLAGMLDSIETNTVLIADHNLLERLELKEKVSGDFSYAPLHQCYPRGVSVALLGLQKLNDGFPDSLYSLQPTYLRRSQAEIMHDNKKKV